MWNRLSLFAVPPLIVLVAAAYLVKLSAATEDASVDQKASERLTLYRQTILGEYEKYRYLPYMLARDPRATLVLKLGRPADVSNKFLEEMADRSGADLLYVMDRSGRTLASSNWREDHSLVGQNYAFRPYFNEALRGGEGQFFAIGATSGEPGLFLSLPTPVEGEPDGVAAVKVDMQELEKTWTEGGETVFLSDANGVIFLTSIADWRYRTLAPLPKEIVEQISLTRQYANRVLEPLSSRPIGESREVQIGSRTFRHNTADVGLLGWTLHFLVPKEKAGETGLVIWISAAGISLFYIVGVLVYRGRALRAVSARLREESIALRELNDRLVAEVDERRKVEAELRTAQNRLARSSRLAAVGQMSAAVAHELNQPLAALRMFVAGARKFLKGGNTAAVEDNLKEIDSLQLRMAALTHELKRFARPAERRIETVDVRTCVRAAEKILQPHLEETGVGLSVEMPDKEVMIETAPLKVEQVLVNLLRNGADAASGAEAGQVRLEVLETPQEVVLTVADNGSGIPDALRERIFDPFFSTKLSDGGLGLGLAISDRIAADIGGSLALEPGSSGGAVFRFTLPKTELPAIETSGKTGHVMEADSL